VLPGCSALFLVDAIAPQGPCPFALEWVIVVSGVLSCEFGFVGLGFRWVQVADFRSSVFPNSLCDTANNEAPLHG
jgi:hypothetical protein